MSTQLLKKITVSKCEITKDDLLKVAIAADGKAVSVLKVYGRCTGSEEKLSDFGPYTLFRGAFEGVNLLTGNVYRSGLMIVQGPAEGMLGGAASFISKDGGEVPFAYEIGVRYVKNEKGNPYQFTAIDLLEGSKLIQSDPLAQLREAALAGGSQPKLTVGKSSSVKA